MGIFEIHFHDSEFEFEWTFSPQASGPGPLPFGGRIGSDRSESASGSETSTPSVAPKFTSAGLVALVVVGAVAFNRLRSRRARRATGTDPERGDKSGGRRLSLSRSK